MKIDFEIAMPIFDTIRVVMAKIKAKFDSSNTETKSDNNKITSDTI